MSPRVSVIIPTYRHKEHILRTLDSVRAQEFSDLEIIVVDDGSTDGTESVLRPLAGQGVIRYHRQQNRGAAAARNAGLAMARGEYVAYLDDDDLWPPDKLAWQVACLDSAPVIAVGGTMRCFKGAEPELVADGDGGSWRAVGLPDFFREGNVFQTPGQVLVRRSALIAAGGFDEALWGTDDFDLWMRLVRAGEVRLHDRLAVFYRVHGGNISADLVRMTLNNEAAMLKTAAEVPAQARRLLRSGYRNLFRWQGKRLIWEGARLLLRGQVRDGLRRFRLGLRFGLKGAPFDPVLLGALILALLKIPYKIWSKP